VESLVVSHYTDRALWPAIESLDGVRNLIATSSVNRLVSAPLHVPTAVKDLRQKHASIGIAANPTQTSCEPLFCRVAAFLGSRLLTLRTVPLVFLLTTAEILENMNENLPLIFDQRSRPSLPRSYAYGIFDPASHHDVWARCIMFVPSRISMTVKCNHCLAFATVALHRLFRGYFLSFEYEAGAWVLINR
jgi:hypothetical protein